MLLKAVVGVLEQERARDKEPTRKERPFKELLSALSPRPVLEKASVLIRDQKPEEALVLFADYSTRAEEAVGELEKRLIYYSRLASLGSMAAIVVHEVRNHLSVIGTLCRIVREAIKVERGPLEEAQNQLTLAEKSLRSMERIANQFAPLASRAFASKRKDSILEEVIRNCVSMRANTLKAKKIKVEIPDSETTIAVDPGEASAVFVNLIDNAIYWLSQQTSEDRTIRIRLLTKPDKGMVAVEVSDNGPGVPEEYIEKIFLPGVTQKPDGFGMGLTVATDLIDKHGGRLALAREGELGGATFLFEFPLSRSEDKNQ